MKAQFKYAFREGLKTRGYVFAVIFIMNLVFITLGSLGLLPFAAMVTAVSLGGVAIAVMMAMNIVGDVAVIRRMFAAPGAYLLALTPAPRRKTLATSVVAMMVMDIASMAAVIIGEVWLSFLLAGDDIGSIVWDALRANASEFLYGIWYIALLLAGYLLLMMMILFCITIRKSVLYQKPAGGFLTLLLAMGTVYAVSLSTLILAPFGAISRLGVFFTITLGNAGTALYALLTLIQAGILFVLTAKLMERKMNI